MARAANPQDYIPFPPVEGADASGLLAITPHLSRALLLSAYQQGIFPWTTSPVGWFAPPERGVLLPETAHFPSNFARLLRRAQFCYSFDVDFAGVIAGCRHAHAQDGEWITPAFVRAYRDLHRQGYAHSVEIWQADTLVGGLYGVQVGAMFCAESMFSRQSNASKAALWALLRACPGLELLCVDVQVVNDTTSRLGAQRIARATYMELLMQCLQARPMAPSRWRRPVAPLGDPPGGGR